MHWKVFPNPLFLFCLLFRKEVRSSNKPRPVFRSGPRDVSCRVSLMTRSQGGRTFNKEMKSGSVVRVGQELQIRGQVREGDGN